MKDLIERQAAIDALTPHDDDYRIRDVLEDLPSAQPETHDERTETHACDLISRAEAIEALEKIDCSDGVGISLLKCDMVDDAVTAIKALPSAQPKRMPGKWIPVTNGRGGHECSLCHSYAPSYKSGDEWLTDYCPHCGVRMEGE